MTLSLLHKLTTPDNGWEKNKDTMNTIKKSTTIENQKSDLPFFWLHLLTNVEQSSKVTKAESRKAELRERLCETASTPVVFKSDMRKYFGSPRLNTR